MSTALARLVATLPELRPPELRSPPWRRRIWTLVGLFRAADRYFSDPFQLHRLEFGAWEALAQSLLSAYDLGRAHAARRRDRPAVCLPREARWAAPIGVLLAAAFALPGRARRVYQLAYPLLMGFPLRPRRAARGACRRCSRSHLPDAVRDVLGDRRRDLDADVRAPLAGARAARLAVEDAARERAARGAEDAAPPALSLQHAEQHPAARLPRRRRRVAHGRAPRGPAAPLAPERDAATCCRCARRSSCCRSTSRSSRRASRTASPSRSTSSPTSPTPSSRT